MYANVDLGYRLRGEYTDPTAGEPDVVDRSYTPGAELVFNAEAGYSPMDKLLVALKYEGVVGAEYDAISNPGTPERISQSVTYLVPTVLVGVHPNVSLEASARMTVSGSRYFAGPTYAVGLSCTGSSDREVGSSRDSLVLYLWSQNKQGKGLLGSFPYFILCGREIYPYEEKST